MVESSRDPNATVLVVEDEQEIRELMALHLLRQGYKVIECSSAERAIEQFSEKSFQLVVLDWMLPGMSGLGLLPTLKQKNPNTPVLMVTAKTEAQDIVFGLESGADDYLTKPFDPSVFLARVRALLRRHSASENVTAGASTNVGSQAAGKILFRGLALNLNTYEVKLDEEPLHLTPSEFKLLTTLLETQGRVLTRDQLIDNIQGQGINVTGRTIDTHVFGLRKKLGTWSENLETIRGVGYRLKMDPS
ncbi:MAG: response regulator transcription factor [Proteobacteria bacterium]|nr:MAG: response regulator transcription factor [Pseudomonadota bacterium]